MVVSTLNKITIQREGIGFIAKSSIRSIIRSCNFVFRGFLMVIIEPQDCCFYKLDRFIYHYWLSIFYYCKVLVNELNGALLTLPLLKLQK